MRPVRRTCSKSGVSPDSLPSQRTVEAVIIPEPGRNQPPMLVTSVYTLQNGLITSIESQPGPSTP